MLKSYELRDAAALTIGVERMRLIRRWADIGLIPYVGGGEQGVRRGFSLRGLVKIVVCDELRGLYVAEPGFRRVVNDLDAILDQPDEPLNWRNPDGPKHRDAVVLWIAFQRHQIDGVDTEGLHIYPESAAGLIERLTSGEADGSGIAESGIALPLRRIITDLEEQTGEKLV